MKLTHTLSQQTYRRFKLKIFFDNYIPISCHDWTFDRISNQGLAEVESVAEIWSHTIHDRQANVSTCNLFRCMCAGRDREEGGGRRKAGKERRERTRRKGGGGRVTVSTQ